MSEIQRALILPKLLAAAVVALIGLGVGAVAWVSLPPALAEDLWIHIWLGLFMLGCVTPLPAVWFAWKPGLGLSVVLVMLALLGLQISAYQEEEAAVVPQTSEVQTAGQPLPLEEGLQPPTAAVKAVPPRVVDPMQITCTEKYVVRELPVPQLNSKRLILASTEGKGVVSLGILTPEQTLKPAALTPEQQQILVGCKGPNGEDFDRLYPKFEEVK